MITKEKIKKHLKTALKETITFVKNNKSTILTLAVYAVLIPVMGECKNIGGSSTNPLTKPIQLMTDFMTGPVPIGFTLISGATAAVSWGAGWEQSITQRAVKCLGGGAVATGLGNGLSWAGVDNVTGCLM